MLGDEIGVKAGETVTLIAVDVGKAKFVSWTVDGDKTLNAVSINGKNITFVMNSDIKITANFTTRENTPQAEIDYVNETLTDLVPNADYVINGAAVTADEIGSIAIDESWFGDTLSIVKVGGGTTADSTPQNLPIPKRPGAPNASKTDCATPANNDGSITAVTAAMEYSADGGATWLPITGATVTALPPGTYKVRVKAADGASFASVPQTLTVCAYTGGGIIYHNPTVTPIPDTTLETADHVKYIIGYPDGTFRPENNITRAEMAVIFWRLLTNSDKNNAVSGKFSDVAIDEWYAQAVNCLAKIGILTGYENGSFLPEQPITRAEFAAVIERFSNISADASNPFPDISSDYWAVGEIISDYAKGWLVGYPDGTFRPDNNIIRAEAVTIVNRMLERKLNHVDVPAELISLYPDVPADYWAFADVIEASIAHDYMREADGYETWTNVKR